MMMQISRSLILLLFYRNHKSKVIELAPEHDADLFSVKHSSRRDTQGRALKQKKFI